MAESARGAADLVPQVVLAEGEDVERQARFPVGSTIEFADLEEHGRIQALDRLREAEPVSWVPALGGWLVTSHPLARNVLARAGDFTVWAEPNLVRASLGVMMLTSDPPDHERQRQPFDEPFRMRAVRERFEGRVSARVERLLDELAARGSCELAGEFAVPFAIGVAGDILGLSLDDVPKIQGFYEAFAGAMTYDGDPEPQRRADAGRTAFNEILHDELARVRKQPDGSITSAVVNDPATQLTDDEIIAQLRVILFGAIETVESMVVNAVLLLLEHPEELDAVRADPSLVGNAVEEAMRLIPPVAFIERWTSAPTTLGGVELDRGEFVGVSTLAANRDPEVFKHPDRFDVRRDNATHQLAFSFGVHHCLGFNMARLQGPIAVKGILDRLPGLQLVESPEPRGFAFRRPTELHLRWQA
ncbi:MAG: cytochrome P450 [Actinomycetota bacterium]|nr:cytochrome P450 [Actinomycetota bacterium]